MATGLTTSGGADFDSCFQTGSGNQLLYIYTNSGADIGQRYLNVSEGSAYGTTNFYASDGVDIGNKLCKIGSNYTTITITPVTSWNEDGYFYGYAQYSYSYLDMYGGSISPGYWQGLEIGAAYYNDSRSVIHFATNATFKKFYVIPDYLNSTEKWEFTQATFGRRTFYGESAVFSCFKYYSGKRQTFKFII